MINKLILIIGLISAVGLHCADEDSKFAGTGVIQVRSKNWGYFGGPRPENVADETTNQFLREYLKVWPELQRLGDIRDQRRRAENDFMSVEIRYLRKYGCVVSLGVALARCPGQCYVQAQHNKAQRNYDNYNSAHAAPLRNLIISNLQKKGCSGDDILLFISEKCKEASNKNDVK